MGHRLVIGAAPHALKPLDLAPGFLPETPQVTLREDDNHAEYKETSNETSAVSGRLAGVERMANPPSVIQQDVETV
jgi:hypothetical protein